MTLFMDVHSIEGGVAASDVAAAQKADLRTQGMHGVDYLRYWVDEEAGKSFALSRHRTQRQRIRSTGKLMGWSLTRSTLSPSTARSRSR